MSEHDTEDETPGAVTEDAPGADAAPEQPGPRAEEVEAKTDAPVAEGEESDERGLEASPPSPEDELRSEVDNLREQLLRRRAEFENFRRRVDRERAQVADDAVGELLTELLPTIDNLERAATAEGDEQSVREGVSLILRTLNGLLDARGVEVENPEGQPFDPERHQALAHEPAPGFADGTIVEVFQKGYLLGGRLLRPALVRVAKGEDEAAEAADGETLH